MACHVSVSLPHEAHELQEATLTLTTRGGAQNKTMLVLIAHYTLFQRDWKVS